MFRNLLKNIRAQIIAAILATGASSSNATTFVGSIGDGQLLQMLLQWFSQNGPELEQFIQFIVSLFAASQASQPPTA